MGDTGGHRDAGWLTSPLKRTGSRDMTSNVAPSARGQVRRFADLLQVSSDAFVVDDRRQELQASLAHHALRRACKILANERSAISSGFSPVATTSSSAMAPLAYARKK